MAMTAEELSAYRGMSDAEKRAVRRRLSEEHTRRDEARRAQPVIVNGTVPCSIESVFRGARADLEAFERGDGDLMGMPHHLVNFPAAYDAIDRELDHRAGYSGGISEDTHARAH